MMTRRISVKKAIEQGKLTKGTLFRFSAITRLMIVWRVNIKEDEYRASFLDSFLSSGKRAYSFNIGAESSQEILYLL